MKPVPLPLVLLIAFFPSMNAFAESEINTTASFDPALCTQESQLNSALNQTTDLLTTVASLMVTCPENAVQIAALASNLNPSLTREIYLVLFSDVVDDQRVQLAVDACAVSFKNNVPMWYKPRLKVRHKSLLKRS
ncbi:hypothetical protein VC_0933 [Vibrio cholerae O1 biovar El Tor str. N16961]|uniref:Uncharacterized protein n=1 Tax=Vibrio cholerae serotype O1 (strain ATCC 39315 / El Tor Inaba N16961) TaxID=243277 RepID=Q9KTG9_VIBCH|nr:hypothetical protein VC_0933 [Vibrio cholerae O1 biovar El Tor str. N16961]